MTEPTREPTTPGQCAVFGVALDSCGKVRELQSATAAPSVLTFSLKSANAAAHLARGGGVLHMRTFRRNALTCLHAALVLLGIGVSVLDPSPSATPTRHGNRHRDEVLV